MSLGGDVGQEKNDRARRFGLGLGGLSRGKLCKLVKSFSGFELAASSVTEYSCFTSHAMIQKENRQKQTFELFSSFKFGPQLIKMQVAN